MALSALARDLAKEASAGVGVLRRHRRTILQLKWGWDLLGLLTARLGELLEDVEMTMNCKSWQPDWCTVPPASSVQWCGF